VTIVTHFESSRRLTAPARNVVLFSLPDAQGHGHGTLGFSKQE